MKQMTGLENLAIITNRQIRANDIHHSFVTNLPIDLHVLETANANPYLFPLYIYPDKEKEKPKKGSTGIAMMLFEERAGYNVKRPNIDEGLYKKLQEVYGIASSPRDVKAPNKKSHYHSEPFVSLKGKLREESDVDSSVASLLQNDSNFPEQIFYYIYAVLYSNIYRQKYQEFLKIDFPRIPFTADLKLFEELSELGKELVDLHLLKTKSLSKPIAKFNGKGDSKVEKLVYEPSTFPHPTPLPQTGEGRLYINKDQYFNGIEEEVYNYQIGGYQVLNKWLKDRKSRTLSSEDIKHYCRVVTALKLTIELQVQIDKLYPEVEKNLIAYSLSSLAGIGDDKKLSGGDHDKTINDL